MSPMARPTPACARAPRGRPPPSTARARARRPRPSPPDGEPDASLRKGDDVETISLDRAAELLADRRTRPAATKKKAAKKPGTAAKKTPAAQKAPAAPA